MVSIILNKALKAFNKTIPIINIINIIKKDFIVIYHHSRINYSIFYLTLAKTYGKFFK